MKKYTKEELLKLCNSYVQDSICDKDNTLRKVFSECVNNYNFNEESPDLEYDLTIAANNGFIDGIKWTIDNLK